MAGERATRCSRGQTRAHGNAVPEKMEDFDARKFWIRIEPLLVDFTKKGTVYMIFFMFKWFALSMV